MRNLKNRSVAIMVLALVVLAVMVLTAGAAFAGPRHCVTYDFAGSELCVSENGVEGADRFVPGDPTWFCVIYTFSGGEICVSSEGEIRQT